MPRFAILTHDHPFLHWDLMLESGGHLRTWRLLEEPAPARSISAESLPDHRTLYLDYEGPVSGNRGHVTRWDAGTFEIVRDDKDALRIVLQGQRLRISAELRPTLDELHWEFGPDAAPDSTPG